MTKLPTKDILLIRHKEVNEYFEKRKIHHLTAKLGLLAVRAVLRPEVLYTAGTAEFIDDQTAQRNPMILVANHARYMDHFPLLTAWNKTNTVMWAKSPYFQNFKDRWLTEILGNGIPVWRDNDKELLAEQELGLAYVQEHPNDESLPSVDEISNELKIMMGRSQVELLNASLARMAMGDNITDFPTGTRKKGDWTMVGDLLPGTAILAHKAKNAKGLNTSIITAGIAYDMTATHNWYRPVVYFGDPIIINDQTRKEINQQLKDNMQYSLDAAHAQIKIRH